MSVPHSQVEEPQVDGDNPSHPQPDATSPRKRRRRAPTTGAADDCFACQERLVKCDRRRPYCTPCLDLGKDCSGYKTALTWGVGVASRGKLRGLSLPIASSKKAASSHHNDEDTPESPPRKMTKTQSVQKESSSRIEQPEEVRFTSPASTTTTTPTTYGFVNIDPTASASSASTPSFASHNLDWRRPQSLSHARNARVGDRKPRRHTLQPISVSAMHPARDYGVMPMTASVVGGYGHHDFGLSSQISPLVPSFSGYEISQSPKAFAESSSAPYETNFAAGHLPWTNQDMMHSGLPDVSHQTSADVNGGHMAHVEHFVPMHQDLVSSPTAIAGSASHAPLLRGSVFEDYANNTRSTLVPDDVGDHTFYNMAQPMETFAVGKTPRLQYLIEHYSRAVSPLIIASGDLADPLSNRILRLASNDEHLQHAIAALALCNLRTGKAQKLSSNIEGFQSDCGHSRAHPERKSSLVNGTVEGFSDASTGEHSSEELLYKVEAIQTLSERLAHPVCQQDDSVLATLLILCLYHVCDTGVAKFKTQLLEVKRLVALQKDFEEVDKQATNWLTMMFTWFDTMGNSVNDKGSQSISDERDASSLRGDEWALENLAGCDSRLFKLITKLGRLNVLSQNRSASQSQASSRHSSLSAAHPSTSPALKDYYSMSSSNFTPPPAAMTAAGWSNVRDLPQHHPPTPSPSPPRTHQFLTEWHELYHALTSWTPPSFSPSCRSGPYYDYNETVHISNAFRYTALIYLSHLLHPSAANADGASQDLVSKAVYHISHIASDVFILWPLFITGTESVGRETRGLIRHRCLTWKRESGFFNSVSTLEVLGSMWNDIPPADADRRRRDKGSKEGEGQGLAAGMSVEEFNGQAFPWRKAMQRADGEYIAV